MTNSEPESLNSGSSTHSIAKAPSALSPQESERWPFYDEVEIAEVTAVLRSGKVNQWTGQDVADFERQCTRTFQGNHGIALANGSVALELALRAFGIGPGDEVVVSPRSFVASAFCVLLVGAKPIFADVDGDSGNITPHTIARVLTPRVRAIIPVHLAGWPADMPSIVSLAAAHDLKVVEDCAQAHGAAIGGQSVGSFGDAGAFSFCQDKIISTGGEGGFLQFRDQAQYLWAWSFKDHGKNREKASNPSPLPGEFRWLHDMPGTNWRMPGPQAALGRMQLHKLAQWNDTRRQNARIWCEALSHVQGVRIPLPGENLQHAFYKLYFYLDVAEADASPLRAEILRRAAGRGLRVFSGSCSEMYLERAFEHLKLPDCPTARFLGQTSLMVEVHPTLDKNLLTRRADCLAGIIRAVLG